MPSDTSEKMHYHKTTQQFVYILQGTLMIEIEGNRNILSSGQGIFIPAGRAHKVLNESQRDAKFIIVASSNDSGDRFDLE